MNTFSSFFLRLGRTLGAGVRNYHVETLLGLVAFGYSCANFDQGVGQANAAFFFALLFVFAANRWTRGRGRLRWGYYLSWTSVFALMWLSTAGLMCCAAVGAMLLALSPKGLETSRFGRSAWSALSGSVLASMLSGGVCLLMVLILTSCELLFGLDLSEILDYPVYFTAYLLLPLLMFSYIERYEEAPEEPRLRHTVAAFVIAPSSILYTAILWLYTLRILLRWELPDGGVAYMVSAYLIITFIGTCVHHEGRTRWADWYYRWQPLLSLVPLALMWIGSLRRIADYGWTEDRIYLMATVLLLSALQALLLLRREHRFCMLALTAAALLLLTFTPWLNAREVSVRVQRKALEPLLAEVVDPETGKFIEGGAISDTLRYVAFQQADGHIESLEKSMTPEQFRKAYGQYGVWSGWFYLDRKGNSAAPSELLAELWLKGDLPLAPYTTLTTDYRTSLDSNCLILKHNKTEVARWDLLSLYQSMDTAQLRRSPTPLLVQREDNLLVVIPRLLIYTDHLYLSPDEVLVFRR